MSSPSPLPAEPDRAALLALEEAYERWRLAEAALAAAEIRLWTQTLQGADAETRGHLGAETLELREAARAARRQVLDLLKANT